jgi:diguanylate cyclase (GGDEF)-like protein
VAHRDKEDTDLHRTQAIDTGDRDPVDGEFAEGGRTGCLTVIRGRGNDLGKHRVLDVPVVVGRGADCDFVIEDFGASRRHCRVAREGPDQYLLEDLDSTNGTRVDGIKIRGTLMLADGQKIFIGDTVLRFQLYDAMDLKFSSQVTHLLGTDPLTGLQSKRTFDDALDYAITAAARAGEPLSLMMMDMDGIKQINDTHGHLFGAHAIKQAGKLIEQVLAGRGQASRFGGDEFTAFMRGRGKKSALQVAEKIRADLEAAHIEKDGILLHPTISIGVAALPEDGKDVVSLVSAADKALYDAKAQGKNRVSGAKP